MIHTRLVSPFVIAVLALAVAGCSKSDGTANAAPAGGAPGASGGPGAAGGRGGPSAMLAASDVGTVSRGSIEAGAAVTGDLRPIETVEVRARLEGDLTRVNVQDGERVRQGQVLAQFEASEQESNRSSAVAERVSAQTEVETAKWNLDQAQELFRAGAIAERELRVAQQTLVSSRARYAATEARVRSTSSFVTDARVLSPITGTVEQRHVQAGERVSRGASLFTIVRNDVLELAAKLPARRANEVRPGQSVRFTVGGREFSGRVARVSPTVDPATRSVTVYAQVPNPGGAILGNSFASGRVVSRTVTDALLLPLTAVRQSQGDGAPPFVFRIAGNKLERAVVRLGVMDESAGIVEVLDGLREGDRVVIGNVGALGAGMSVQVVGGDAGRR